VKITRVFSEIPAALLIEICFLSGVGPTKIEGCKILRISEIETILSGDDKLPSHRAHRVINGDVSTARCSHLRRSQTGRPAADDGDVFGYFQSETLPGNRRNVHCDFFDHSTILIGNSLILPLTKISVHGIAWL